MAKYTTDFKLTVIEHYLNQHSYQQTAKHFNLEKSTVRLWVKLYQAHDIDGILNDLLVILDLPRSVFYYHLKYIQQQTTQADKDQPLKAHIKHIYHTHKGRYGCRRITIALNHNLMVKALSSTTKGCNA